ncbi:MAG: UDP-N-acetylenolpyruvoylglucosamine reductase [Acetatifactor sp.]|nr:UDP-N-acetylenolpyruvoylglucosamine reductase [Acetatifactor sp.]MDE7354060.1 UDP-N-acetylenolpyruvoylglucosamine reductase [Acetatifactor sp.]
MTALRKDAIDLLERIPEDKLFFIVQIMQGINGLYGEAEQTARDKAFEKLESLRRKDVHLNYDEELKSYREGKYGSADIN